jgi:hypothetical protein
MNAESICQKTQSAAQQRSREYEVQKAACDASEFRRRLGHLNDRLRHPKSGPPFWRTLVLLLDAVAYELAPIIRPNQELTLRQKLARHLVLVKWNGIDYEAFNSSQSRYQVSHVQSDRVSTVARFSREDAATGRCRGQGGRSNKQWL